MSAGVARILRDAARALELNGWCQGQKFDGKKSCAVGAIDRVCLTNSADWWAENTNAVSARRALGQHLNEMVATWNDAPGRTQTEVVKLFLTVADLEEVQS